MHAGLGRQGTEHGTAGDLCGLLAYEDVVGGWPDGKLPLADRAMPRLAT